VLGAPIQALFSLLTLNFLKLVGISLFFAVPLRWYLMNDWLEGFHYHIELSWVVFVVAGLITAAIALFTVSFEAIKASLVNPSQGLKSE